MSVALVTGGSRGIGRAIVEELAAARYAVAFTYAQNRDAAEALAACIAQRGQQAMACQADVRDFARAADVVKSAQETLGPIDLLINNAGIRRDRALHNMDPAEWQEVIDTNLTGTFNYARAVIPGMLRRGGVILNISSVSGVMGIAGQTNYSASKAGMIGFTKALSREVARFGIRVNAVVPGVIETDMTASMEEPARKRLFGQIPAGKPGTAHHVASMVLYLASADSEYATGQVFTIDGGLS
jgi:3-oxoacyl-[acyl-carrier protein] reductase